MRHIQSGKLINFTKQEYLAALNGLTALINRLNNTITTMNSQDPDREIIEQKVIEIGTLRKRLEAIYKELGNVNV